MEAQYNNPQWLNTLPIFSFSSRSGHLINFIKDYIFVQFSKMYNYGTNNIRIAE
jgi:hypothetical protein